MSARKLGVAAVFVLMLLLRQSTLWAQGNTASLGGTITDEQSLRLPGVSLTLEGVESGLKRNLTSGTDGTFVFTALPPGEYKLHAEFTGFAVLERRVTLAVNQDARLDFVLSVSSQSETVEVQDTAPLLHPNEASVGQVVENERVSQLPLNGRQFLELSLLVPGVHDSHGAQKGNMNSLYWRPGQSSAISVSGGRPNSNTYLLDGTINTDPSFNTYVISLPPDVIREFQIATGTYSAELGGAGTGQVNVVTKAGTNSIHGSVYEYFRNNHLDEPLFTDPDMLPHFSQNQFGGTAGGPIRKDHTYFFAAYEAFRVSQGQSMIMSVPSLAMRLGDFSGQAPIYDPNSTQPNPSFDRTRPESPSNPQFLRTQFPNNKIPGDRINPAARTILARLIPLPNLEGDFNNLIDNRSQHITNDMGNLRLDHIFGEGATSVFGRYSGSGERGYTPENLPGFGSFNDNRVQNLSLTTTHLFTEHLIGEFRGGLQRMRLHRYSERANKEDLVNTLGISGVGFGGPEAYGLPLFNIQNYQPFGDSLLCTPCFYWNTLFQVGGKMTWIHGNHSVKFGADIQRFRWNMQGYFQNRGYFQFSPGFTTRTATNDGTGDALASFLLGLPVIASRQAGDPAMRLRQNMTNSFIQDDWRVSDHLTVNLGLRYELRTPLHEVSDRVLSNLSFDTGVPVMNIGGQGGFPLGLAYADKNNLAPRIGIAYSPGDGKWVFRSGYGMFYSYPDMNLWCSQVHNVPLVFPETLQSNNFVPSNFGFGFAPAVLGQTRVAITALDPHAHTAYVQQLSVTIERQLSRSTMLQAGFVSAWAKKLDRARLINNAPPAAGPVQPRRPYQSVSFAPGDDVKANVPIISTTFPVSAMNYLENSASSSYNSGYLLVKRNLSRGLSFVANYTFSKNLTDAPAFRSPAMESEVPQNSYDLRSEWGLAGCDITHRFVTSLIYNLPFSSKGQGISGLAGFAKALVADWQVGLIYSAQSGFPYTVGVFGDTANAGALLNVNPIRADVVPGVSADLPSDQRNTDHWFNTEAFRTPAAFTFGTAGRNTMRGPSLKKADVAMERHFALRETTQLSFRAEFFNLFNRANYDTPERFVNTPQFGTVTMAATPARQIQFALRFQF